jgi:hypothetical protein
MQLQLAIRSLRETCALHHTALDTEKFCTHWLIRYAAFLKRPKSRSPVTTEEKMEAFLASLAIGGVPVVPPLGDVALTYLEEALARRFSTCPSQNPTFQRPLWRRKMLRTKGSSAGRLNTTSL